MKSHITIGFSTTNKWMSKAIRTVMGGSPVSHAWISFYGLPPWQTTGDEMRWVIQAEAHGVELMPWEMWKKQGNIPMAEFTPIGPDLHWALGWAGTKVGIDYDYSAAFFSGIWAKVQQVSRWFGYWAKGRLLWSPGKMMCSELVTRFLQTASYLAVEGVNPETFNPFKLLQRCVDNPGQFCLEDAHPLVVKKLKLPK